MIRNYTSGFFFPEAPVVFFSRRSHTHTRTVTRIPSQMTHAITSQISNANAVYTYMRYTYIQQQRGVSGTVPTTARVYDSEKRTWRYAPANSHGVKVRSWEIRHSYYLFSYCLLSFISWTVIWLESWLCVCSLFVCLLFFVRLFALLTTRYTAAGRSDTLAGWLIPSTPWAAARARKKLLSYKRNAHEYINIYTYKLSNETSRLNTYSCNRTYK